jgi:hypothetical protein
MANTAQIVQDLNAGWRNYINNLLALNKDTFQLAQGTLGLQTTDSSGLFLMEDAVPPSTTVGYYSSSTMKSRASAYLGLLSALLPETSPIALQQALSDMYSDWITYKTTKSNWTAGATLLSVYNAWAEQSSIDPGRAARGKAAIQAAQNAPLSKAYDAYNAAANQQTFTGTDGKAYTLYKYTGNNQDAVAAINGGGGPASINFDSSSMDTSTSSTFIQGSASGFYSIFSGGAGASFDQENATAAGTKFTITGTINKYATLSCGPGAWYTSGEVSRAFNGKGDANIWDPQASAGNWDSFFGQPNGALARFVAELILVSDYDIKVTSHASYSDSQYRKITAQASFGIWPFFSASASSSQTTSVTHNADSTLTVEQKLGKGLIQIWGVNVLAQS